MGDSLGLRHRRSPTAGGSGWSQVRAGAALRGPRASASRPDHAVSTSRPRLDGVAPARARPARRPRPGRRRPARRSGSPLAQPQLQQHPLHPPGLRVEQLAAVGRAEPGRHPLGVRRGVPDVPPAHPADVGVRARARRPTSPRRSSRGGCAGSALLVAGPVRDLVPTQPGRRRAARRPGRTCRRGRPRRASAARRGGPAGPGRCRPRRSASTPRRGRARRPARRRARSPSRPATPPACRRSGRG